MLLLEAYLAQHAAGHEAELTDEIESNAAVTVARANELCARAGIDLVLRSGWRPAAYNAGLPGAAPRSSHLTGEAVDISDEDGRLRNWCMQHLNDLAEIGLWMEDPRTTPGWLHVQIGPPASGHRVYIPSADWQARLQPKEGTA